MVGVIRDESHLCCYDVASYIYASDLRNLFEPFTDINASNCDFYAPCNWCKWLEITACKLKVWCILTTNDCIILMHIIKNEFGEEFIIKLGSYCICIAIYGATAI